MNRQLNVLLIEDNEEDVFLTLRYLRQHWAEVMFLQVDTLAKLTEALKSHWDIILSDFNLPGFDGMTALRTIRESGINTPFILVSGEVTEDVAALMMRLGANDYVMKGNLNRLAPAILRELKYDTPPDEGSAFGNHEKTGRQKPHSVSNKLLPPIVPSGNDVLENKPITERHKAVINLLYVTEYIRKHQSAILEKQNLTVPRVNILRILKRFFPESTTIRHINEEIIYKTIDLSRMIEKMKHEGLVNSSYSQKNKTSKEITITAKGLEALNAADKYYDEMFLPENYLSEENAEKVNEALQETLRMIK